MKRAILTVMSLGLFISSATYVHAIDHAQMHEMMMKEGGPKSDDRVELKFPEPVKVMQKGMMRRHLSSISEITAALAANDLTKAAAIARENLGWTPEEEQRCTMMGELSGEKDFLPLGKAMHKKADELADAAKAGERDKALTRLSELINNCNACHDRYRH